MSEQPHHLSFPSPIGPLTIFAEGGAIIVIESGKVPVEGSDDPLLVEARDQLNGYFDGKLAEFDLPLAPVGTDRQKQIWAEMNRIPYGVTISYGELAKRTGSVARAVGGACGANPIPIIQPCHRVVGAKDALTGFSFADGPETKHQLLKLEGVML